MSQSCCVLRGGDRGEHLQCIKGMAITLTVYVPFLFTLFKTKHVPLFSSFKFTKANENLHYSRTKRWFKEPFLPDQKSKEKQVLHTNLPPGKNLTFIDRIACQPSSTQEISSYTDSWGRRSWFNISRYPRWYLIAKRDILQRRKIDHFDTEIHNPSAPTGRGNRESKWLCTMLPRFENHKGAHHLPREVVRF